MLIWNFGCYIEIELDKWIEKKRIENEIANQAEEENPMVIV